MCGSGLSERNLEGRLFKDENGNYKQELRLKMKKESQKHCFSCPECGESLILNAGNIRQPYFSHYAGSDCVLTSKEQAERNQLMRQAMLLLAKAASRMPKSGSMFF